MSVGTRKKIVDFQRMIDDKVHLSLYQILYEDYVYRENDKKGNKNKSKNLLGNKRMKINYQPRHGKDILTQKHIIMQNNVRMKKI